MLGVLPFVEDPDISVSTARTLAQHLPTWYIVNITPPDFGSNWLFHRKSGNIAITSFLTFFNRFPKTPRTYGGVGLREVRRVFISVIFIGPRYTWGPIYGSESLKLSTRPFWNTSNTSNTSNTGNTSKTIETSNTSNTSNTSKQYYQYQQY